MNRITGQLAIWYGRLERALARARQAYRRQTCPHTWRPARIADGLARYCPRCETLEPLSVELFYAYFGSYWP